jgi:hypothetical protein
MKRMYERTLLVEWKRLALFAIRKDYLEPLLEYLGTGSSHLGWKITEIEGNKQKR